MLHLQLMRIVLPVHINEIVANVFTTNPWFQGKKVNVLFYQETKTWGYRYSSCPEIKHMLRSKNLSMSLLLEIIVYIPMQ